MMNPRYDMRLEFSVMMGSFQVLLWRDEDGKREILSESGFIPHRPGDYVSPSIHLRQHEAQQLMDDLWRGGIRPSQGKGSAGSLAATEKHLEDMRTIAFDQLRVKT